MMTVRRDLSGKAVPFVWTPKLEALLGTATDEVIAAQLQVTPAMVGHRRRRLGIPSFRRTSSVWTQVADALLGTASDSKVAAQLQIHPSSVKERRNKLGIPAYNPSFVWTPEKVALLGTELDPVIARKLGIGSTQVQKRRIKLGIPAFRPPTEPLKNIIARLDLPPVPAERRVAPTERRFVVDQPLVLRMTDTFPDTEDKQLTAYLEQVLDDVYTTSLRPPSCPHCYSRRTILKSKPHARMRVPSFACLSCDRGFNRVTGTPLARLHAEKLPLFIRLLSQQIPYGEACRQLGVSIKAISNWTRKFRTWLLQLDPSGKWEAKARLGIKPKAYIPCPRCGMDGEKGFGGVNAKTGRQLACPACRTCFSVRDAERLTQQKLRLEVGHDPGKVN